MYDFTMKKLETEKLKLLYYYRYDPKCIVGKIILL